jgi:hypothetical protein
MFRRRLKSNPPIQSPYRALSEMYSSEIKGPLWIVAETGTVRTPGSLILTPEEEIPAHPWVMCLRSGALMSGSRNCPGTKIVHRITGEIYCD